MRELSTALRDAYLTNLGGIIVDGVLIPFYDEALPINALAATLMGAQVYCLLLNQTETDISPKCMFSQEATMTVDIVTKFPQGKGGKYVSELISGLVQIAIYESASGSNLDLSPDFNCLSTRKEMSKGLTEFNTTSTVYRKLLMFSHIVDQITQDTPIT